MVGCSIWLIVLADDEHPRKLASFGRGDGECWHLFLFDSSRGIFLLGFCFYRCLIFFIILWIYFFRDGVYGRVASGMSLMHPRSGAHVAERGGVVGCGWRSHPRRWPRGYPLWGLVFQDRGMSLEYSRVLYFSFVDNNRLASKTVNKSAAARSVWLDYKIDGIRQCVG